MNTDNKIKLNLLSLMILMSLTIRAAVMEFDSAKNGAGAKRCSGELRLQLIEASRDGDVEKVKELLEAGADANSATEMLGVTALCVAALNGEMGIVEILLENGADVDFMDDIGWTALNWAISYTLASIVRRTEAVKILLRAGADVNIDMKESRVLNSAVCMGDAEIVKILLEAGADINFVDGCFKTALMRAARGGDKEIVEILLDNGADVNLSGKYGDTALMEAANSGNGEVVKALLERGAEVNAVGQHGCTAIMSAAIEGYVGIVEMLLENSAKKPIKEDILKFAFNDIGIENIERTLERAEANLKACKSLEISH